MIYDIIKNKVEKVCNETTHDFLVFILMMIDGKGIVSIEHNEANKINHYNKQKDVPYKEFTNYYNAYRQSSMPRTFTNEYTYSHECLVQMSRYIVDLFGYDVDVENEELIYATTQFGFSSVQCGCLFISNCSKYLKTMNIYNNIYMKNLIFFLLDTYINSYTNIIGSQDLDLPKWETGEEVIHHIFKNLLLPSYSCISNISCSYYEGQECIGKISFKETDNDFNIEAKFEYEYNIENVRNTRKLLEMTKNHYLIVNQLHKIIGIGTNKAGIELYTIEFLGYMKWQFKYGDTVIFKCIDNKISVSQNDKDDIKALNNLDMFFKNESIEKISSIIMMAKNQIHGALIIITEPIYIENEVDRLFKLYRCIKLSIPVQIYDNLELILSLTSIDGAIIISTDGLCYAIGAILDGEALAIGNSARGSRYNSAVTYINWKKEKEETYIAAVISSDGGLDIIK